jgi:hypothetical protein
MGPTHGENRYDSRDRRHTKYRPTHYTGHCWSRSAERLLKGRVAELTGSPAATMAQWAAQSAELFS